MKKHQGISVNHSVDDAVRAMNKSAIDESVMLSQLKTLVSIESINPSLVHGGSGESEIAEYIGGSLEKLGFETRYQTLDDGRLNVIGVLQGSGEGRSLMLNGHTDTVGIVGMEIEPLKPVYEDGKVYGRGAFDMKGGLAAMLAVGEAIVRSKLPMRGDLILAFVADEEYGSRGTEELIKQFTADAAIVTEPTGLQVVVAHRGFAWAKINVRGKAVHGSLHEEGVDAIVNAGKVLVALGELDQSFKSRHHHPLLGRASVHASLIEGGSELSTYPANCELQLERRTIPGESREHVAEELEGLVKSIRQQDSDFAATSEVFFDRPCLETRSDAPIVQEIISSSEKITRKTPELIGALWWTDAALLSEAGIPSILFGSSGKGGHAPVEYVDFASLTSTAKILLATAVSFCNKAV
jgi:acetylornithine deacetylase